MKTYEGKPCEHGHTTRYVSNRKCVACSRIVVKYAASDEHGRMLPTLHDDPHTARLAAFTARGALWRCKPIK